MRTEDKLKIIILERYGSMVDFSKSIGIPNSTLATIMKKGIHNANISNIIKICKALNISTDELAQDRIVPVHGQDLTLKELGDAITFHRLSHENYTIDGKPISEDEAEMIYDSLYITIEMIKKRREKA